jgi:PEP-CTERM motif
MKALLGFCTLAIPFAFAPFDPRGNWFVLKGVKVFSSVPEPLSLLLFGAGILALAALSRKRSSVTGLQAKSDS